MFGIEMMLKSMGIEPEEIKKSVGDFGKMVIDLKEQMDRIERKLDAAMKDAPQPAAEESEFLVLETQEKE